VRRTCPACGKPQGSNASCLSCRDAAARELAEGARDVTRESLAGRADRLSRWLEKPPWWAAAAPKGLLARLRLFWMLVRDYVSGRYRDASWRTLASVAAAAAYVLAPIDLVPDLLGPLGFTDDVLVLAIAWRLARRELRRYCEWKGLSPAHFGLGESEREPRSTRA
jgi:uncharacterized membrane protein YkvA (DUF1232 family)